MSGYVSKKPNKNPRPKGMVFYKIDLIELFLVAGVGFEPDDLQVMRLNRGKNHQKTVIKDKIEKASCQREN